MSQFELLSPGGIAPGGLFQDPMFPVADQTPNDIFWSVSWKRPHELSKRPEMFVDGPSRSDIVQGILGDCWFLSACIAVAQHPHLLWHIIPHGQVLYGNGYNGTLMFRFWRMGHWEKVLIDDRLPVDENDELIYSRGTHPDEYWVPLIEKAFAKFHGGYDNLIEGRRMEGLISLTGYVVEDVETSGWEYEDDLFNLLEPEIEHSLITCSARGPYRKGLAGDHTYTVTGAQRVLRSNGDEVRLVRVRNPWGASFDAEWSGAWREGDSRWNEIDQPTKDSLQYKEAQDGEFWMEDNDFAMFFPHISIAMKTPFIDGSPMEDVQNFHVLRGSWEKGISAGGSQKDFKRFATNPQFSLIVKETDDTSIEGNKLVDFCNVILEMIQELNRQKFQSPEGIALFIYKVKRPTRRRLTAKDLRSMMEFGEPSVHERRSAVVYRLQLPPGAYVLVASTYEPNRSRGFVLRSYSRRRVALNRL